MDEQAAALDAVAKWYKQAVKPRGAKRFYLAGYAGTGKTTLARRFAELVDGHVTFAAFTGKAASVLRAKGCPNATTIHSLIYKPKGSALAKRIKELQDLVENERKNTTPDQKKLATWERELKELDTQDSPTWEVKQESEIMRSDLIIVDECSMISSHMGRDLESFNKPILWLGDPGQLPPVGGVPHLKGHPDAMLEEVHRQAADSPILWLATQIRKGKKSQFGTFGDGQVRILKKEDFDWNDLLLADQVLCGLNDTRRKINKRMRAIKNLDALYPLKGDKLICTKNNHDEGLLNGVTCTAAGNSKVVGAMLDLLVNYEDENKTVYVDPGPFEETYGKRESFPPRDAVEGFDYGYAITGHKSQGSQWDSVAVCDDKMMVNDYDFRRKWLYTVVTRAAKNLVMFV